MFSDNNNYYHLLTEIKQTKKVQFDESSNKIFLTYSSREYDRRAIFCMKNLMSLGLVPYTQKNVYQELNYFKQHEMQVHEMSKLNTRLH